MKMQMSHIGINVQEERKISVILTRIALTSSSP